MEDEKIREYMKLTTEQKIEWLEEINELTRLLVTEKEKEFREKLLRGEI